MRILLVATARPWPTRKGYQVRLLQLAEGLAEDHAVTLLLPEGPDAPSPRVPGRAPLAIETYRRSRWSAVGGVAAAAWAPRSLESGLVDSVDLRRRLQELAPQFDLVLLQLVRLAGAAGSLGDTPWVLDLVDSLSLNLERRAAFDRFWMRPLLRFEARRLAMDEHRMIAASAATLLVSERDRRHLAGALPPRLAARLAVIPLAVGAVEGATSRGVRSAGEAELAITGNLGYFPTSRGIRWFLDEVWPEVTRKYSRASLLVAGARPDPRLARRVRERGGRLIADPENLQALLAGADIALAPLFAGSGTPIKLLEALAAGVPVVATHAAADGLDPALARCVAIPEDAAGWISTLHALIANPIAASARAAIGVRLVRELHDPKRVSRLLEEVLQGV